MEWIFMGIALMALLVIWGITVYNRLVDERLKVQTQWSQIDVVLKQRFDMIPNLVETVKGFAAHEKEALEAVLIARQGYLSAKDTDGQIHASTELTGAMTRLMALAEAYPDLKADGNFSELQKQIASIEEKLADYRQFYNDTVLRYNRLLATVPNNIIAGMFHFKAETFFKADKSEKASVTIQF